MARTMDYTLSYFIILLATGLLAGVINTLAGGGSNLTLPALMLTGMPADVANATNRVGVFLQCCVGTKGYADHGKVQADDIAWVLIPNIAGGVVGAVAAAVLPATFLKPLLLLAMIGVAFVILVFPSVIAPPLGTPVYIMRVRPCAWIALFFLGIYCLLYTSDAADDLRGCRSCSGACG